MCLIWSFYINQIKRKNVVLGPSQYQSYILQRKLGSDIYFPKKCKYSSDWCSDVLYEMKKVKIITIKCQKNRKNTLKSTRTITLFIVFYISFSLLITITFHSKHCVSACQVYTGHITHCPDPSPTVPSSKLPLSQFSTAGRCFWSTGVNWGLWEECLGCIFFL